MTQRFSLFAIVSCLAIAIPYASHAAIAPGDLIKGSGSAVYSLGDDHRRYVFPTEATYRTWYDDFVSVKTVSDTELASYLIGGNVTYRPGTRLVKITTDQKVYAVSRGGVLRWIASETIARELFGATWASRIDDIPDGFFVNYRVGATVASASDYDSDAERASAATIISDKTPFVIPPTVAAVSSTSSTTNSPSTISIAPTFTLTMSIPTLTPRAGDTVTVLALAQPAASIASIRLTLDGQLQRTCASAPCSMDLAFGVNATGRSMTLVTEAAWLDGTKRAATTTFVVQASGGVTVTITHPEIRRGSLQEMIVNVDQSLVAFLIDLYVDGMDVRGCNSTQQCRYTLSELSATGTVRNVYAITQDRNGNPRRSATETYRVVDNEHPIATVSLGKSSLLRGETTDVTVAGSDDESVTVTEVWLDGTLVKRCNTASCTATLGPWNTAQTVSVVGRVTDNGGLQGAVTSTPILIQ